jgi:ATP-binding cassette subfamily B protein
MPNLRRRVAAAAARTREAANVLAGTPQVLGLVWESHPVYASGLLGVSVLQGLVPLAQVWIAKHVVDAVAAVFGAGPAATAVDPALATAQVVRLLLLQALITLASQTLDPCGRLLQEQLGDHLTRNTTLRILRKSNALVDLSFFESPRFYDLLQRAQSDAGWRPLGMLQPLGGMLRAVINLVAMLGVLLAFRPLLAVAVVVLSLPHLVVQFRHQRQSWMLHRVEVPEVRLMNYFRTILTSKNDAKEVRLFGLGDHFLERYLHLFEQNHHPHRRLRLGQWRWNVALATLAAFGSAGAYAYVVLQALAGRVTLGGLTFYASAVNQVQGALSNIIYQLAALYESNLSVSNLFEFLALQPAMEPPPLGIGLPVPVPLRQGIEFRNLAFRYPGTERQVLEDISFTIRPGQTVALVGENGAGKTTLVKLLTRLYDPTGGQILVDGVDLREIDLADWRRQSGVVFQD